MPNRAQGLFVAALAIASPTASFAGWPFFAEGPKRGTAEYYCQRSDEPVGERQKFHHGKAWPPFARPCGPEQTCIHKFHANHYWPYPYNVQDRDDVRLALQTQVDNGWCAATTMYDYHFDAGTHLLNSAGQQHLNWIFTQAPPQHRHIYISTAPDTAQNDVRMQSVQKALAGYAGGEASMPVTLRATHPLGRPATEVEQIFTNAATNALPPTIEYQAIGSAASTGGN
ncbi:hypothetical protein Pan44_31870 [Caulifigura coniformis]|uniref:Uncharacterized protein n=1 Tax=Caulifigura coniformis TaxID=2527983 RepID=A0A517SG84_9PLAN|nr:hypothetical protein [Caulifigura coniformis]QDT55145.1 hypothetical protein Pan44_31870 [Caulifigura coniformis]